MPIPNEQLVTWSHQGSVTQSKNTYSSIKNALQSSDAPYADKDISIFLQGSYGNDTNIYSESDVDVVINLNETFQSDLSELSEEEKDGYEKAFPQATYLIDQFKDDVVSTLKKHYGAKVSIGNKAISVDADNSRRKSDVLASIQYRRYSKFNGIGDEIYTEGICFFTKNGQRIDNYPKQHSENCTSKHKRTGNYFKPMVRILKNMRKRMVEKGLIDKKIAPSYYLEGLLYNVPDDCFKSNYSDSFVSCFNWLSAADRTNFVCANEQYYLLREDSPVTWRESHCATFLDAVHSFWENW